MENSRIQYIAIAASVLLFLFILYLIRKKRLREEYSFIWLSFSVVFVILSLWREGLDWISNLMGVAYPPAAIFLILLMAIFLIMIEFSVIISKQTKQIHKLSQDMGILKKEMDDLKKD